MINNIEFDENDYDVLEILNNSYKYSHNQIIMSDTDLIERLRNENNILEKFLKSEKKENKSLNEKIKNIKCLKWTKHGLKDKDNKFTNINKILEDI